MAASSVLAFGNPGAGKSSLLNVLLGAPHFEAGLSMGAGLTRGLRHADLGGVSFYDVPGLSDCRFRREAAAAITEALRQAGGGGAAACRVLFVVTLENGRVRPDDAVTIRAVLMAAPTIEGYGVVVNNLPPPVVRRLADPEARRTIADALMEIIPPTRRTTAFFFQPTSGAMDGEEHHRIDYAACRGRDFRELVTFVERDVRPCRIRPESVTPVDPASFAQMQAQYAALKKEAAELAEKLRQEAAARKLAEQQAREEASRAAKEAEKAKKAEGERDEATKQAKDAREECVRQAARASKAESDCSTAQREANSARWEADQAKKDCQDARNREKAAIDGAEQRGLARFQREKETLATQCLKTARDSVAEELAAAKTEGAEFKQRAEEAAKEAAKERQRAEQEKKATFLGGVASVAGGILAYGAAASMTVASGGAAAPIAAGVVATVSGVTVRQCNRPS